MIRVGLFTQGSLRPNYPLNGVLLIHNAIRRGFEKHPDFELQDFSPPLKNGMDIDREAAAKMHEGVHPKLDLVVAQACIAEKVFERARKICPRAICVLHRESTHAAHHHRVLQEQMDRYDIHYENKVPRHELAEYDLADYITVVSRRVWTSFIQNGIPRDKLIYIGPQVLELHRWRRIPRRWQKGWKKFRFLGKLGLRKGVFDCLNAWKRAGAPGQLIVHGIPEYPILEKPVFDHIQRTPRCEYGGQIEFVNLHRIYHDSAVVIMPSHEEGASMVPFEAMAAGCGVIATAACGNDLLQDGVNGQLVIEGDTKSIATAIQRYAGDDDYRFDHTQHGVGAVAICDVPYYSSRYAKAVRGVLP